MKRKILLLLLPMIVCLFSCESDHNSGDENTTDSTVTTSMSFEQLSPELTGIDFTNTITETETFNYYLYEDIYSGGGVGLGDINNDGLCDIYFSGNQVNDRLYLNKGNLEFEDITESAFDVDLSEGWHTGVSMVDINNDGWLDIYVCRSGDISNRSLFKNLLFVNNGDNTFSEKAADYGLDIERRTTNATFFDYDLDGDLDVYVLNHPHQYEKNVFSASELLALKKMERMRTYFWRIKKVFL